METSLAAAILLHPIGLLILAVIVFAAVRLGSLSGQPGTRIAWQRLLSGFVGVVLAALLVAAISAYVSPEEARRFGVPAENYQEALFREFAKLAVLLTFASAIGCAAVGVPLTVALAGRGLATVPVLVLASIPVSLAFGFALGLLQFSSAHLVRELSILVSTHALLAFAFATGARLRWWPTRSPPNEA